MEQLGNLPLVAKIRNRIAGSGGAIPFSEYMFMCLYDEHGGYYNKENKKVGKEGDFYTSAYIGDAMGWALADFIIQSADGFLRLGEPITLGEWGGGDGRLAKAVLDALKQESPETYSRVQFVSVEASPYHRMLQKEALSAHIDRIQAVIEPGDPAVAKLLASGFTVLYANELLDAFPVRRLRKQGTELKEIFVCWDDGIDSFAEVLRPISQGMDELLRGLGVQLAEGQTIEVNIAAQDWIRRLGSFMTRGIAAIIDYGDVTDELYGGHRMNGTLMCYRKHTAHDNPYLWVGEQDITAHVDFGLCRQTAMEAGFTDAELRTQKLFLLEHGILNRLKAHGVSDPFSQEARNNRAIRQLLLSDGMSELFKVLTIRKNI